MVLHCKHKWRLSIQTNEDSSKNKDCKPDISPTTPEEERGEIMKFLAVILAFSTRRELVGANTQLRQRLRARPSA